MMRSKQISKTNVKLFLPRTSCETIVYAYNLSQRTKSRKYAPFVNRSLPYAPSILSFNASTLRISQFPLAKMDLAIFPLIFSLFLRAFNLREENEVTCSSYTRRSFSLAYCICSSYKAVCKRAIGTWITRPINEYKRHSDAVFTRWNGRVVCHRRQSQPLWLNYRRARNSASFKSALFAAAHLENCIFDSFPANFFHFLLSLFFFNLSIFFSIFLMRQRLSIIRVNSKKANPIFFLEQ